ncbi:thiol reductant ABC exporter subunit CydC [Salisediminibacterium selenitireducens]|uniref:ABC transporter, CydDC cysteine exporter (CydDC-E) family, permease/ATP-binding protein CydC n=1 Tax=Bacillus selenitireducens (strain ATCC 700615 / DSM 15326 / MLS10) TaxID=439292 RepID=D6XYP5_BACIE|nr:thiol reductant ABC exporter subunit CydC [Salisediminibacterium selenitireducens]ADH98203.1 ABC transporter, CydDC cysteine exporter (CydDC-E) family, permease/ATP-binding protein CydC [[Bacillus] selenitireducens MLS10]
MKDLQMITALMLKEKKDLFKSVLYGVLAALGAVALFANSGYLISAAAVTNAFYVLTISIALLKLFSVSRAVFRYFERMVSHRATFTMLGRFRVHFFEKLAPLAPSLSTSFRSGDLLSRVTGDVESLQNYFLRVVYPPVAAAVTFLITVIFTFLFSWQIALLLLGGLVLTSALIPYVYALRQKRTASLIRERRATLTEEVTELYQGQEEWLIHNLLDEKKKKTLDASEELIAAQRKEQKTLLQNQSVNQAVTFIVSVLILTTGAFLAAEGGLNAIFLAMLVMVSLTVFENAAPMATVPVYAEDNQTAGRRLNEATSALPPEEGDALPEGGASSLSLDGVRLAFDEAHAAALDHVDAEMPKGSVTVLVGASGSGKSSVLHLLLGMHQADDGTVSWNGRRIHEYTFESLYENSNIALQDAHFFAGTIRDNLLLANGEAKDADMQKALGDVALTAFTLDDAVDEQGKNLSGGERQRLAFARLLLREASNWFLDEPFSSLDPAMERSMYDLLRERSKGDTVVLVSHRLTGLEEADQIIVMDEGKVAESGTYDELMNRSGIFRQLKEIEQSVFLSRS